MKRCPGTMIAPVVALSGTMILASLAWAEEIPVEEEIARAIIDPCHTKLELFVFGEDIAFGCPGCTVWFFGPDDELDPLLKALKQHGASSYDLLRFMKLMEAVEQSATLSSIFSFGKDIGGVSFAETAQGKGLCGEGNAGIEKFESAPTGAIGRSNRSAAANALSASAGRIRSAIEASWRRPGASLRGLKVVIEIRVGRNGEVQNARIVESSGDTRFDESAELAVKKASPLPIPNEPEYYDHIKEFRIEFNPDE